MPATPPDQTELSHVLTIQQREHRYRDYESRQRHADEFQLQLSQQERQRIERIVYYSGAIPLATLTLSNLHQLPAVLMIFALLLSVFAYGFWYINEFYGSAARSHKAQAIAARWEPYSAAVDRQRREGEHRDAERRTSRNADRTANHVALFLVASFATSGLALVDQFVDVRFLTSPNIELVVAIGVTVTVACLTWWAIEYIGLNGRGSNRLAQERDHTDSATT